ncbi:M12 family metallopeptidase [Pleomorphomonas sp. PLEO]|uniref:M12 family metallopeptidase n=1 Tax=Pleomorphomonas sp. PLEO TaxID=3239306 RepID=UPI00351EF3A3
MKNKIATAMCLFASFSSPAIAACPESPAPDVVAATLGVEQAAGNADYVLVEEGGDLQTIFYTDSGGRAIFEGDIVLGSVEELNALGKDGPISLGDKSEQAKLTLGLVVNRVLNNKGGRWSSGVIPYVINADTPNADTVRKAMKIWQDKTGLKFVKRDNSNAITFPNYVVFRRGTDPNACYSEALGMKGGGQYVDLVGGCGLGQILHEIGHVIGLAHEQNRADRSKFVKVNFENIWPKYAYAFQQHVTQQTESGLYDFDSIMHYEKTAFSCNGLPTIESKMGATFGQRDHLSAGDIKTVKASYNLP